jgi:hypothetical protein
MMVGSMSDQQAARAPPPPLLRSSTWAQKHQSLKEIQALMGREVHVVLHPESSRSQEEGDESAQGMLDTGRLAIGYVALPHIQDSTGGGGGLSTNHHSHFVAAVTVSKPDL